MNSKFSNVPVEEDTKIRFESEVKLGNIGALHQKWCWDGVAGESLIFLNEDVQEMSDEEVTQLLKQSSFFKSLNPSTTISRSQTGFTFLNFNFVS